MTAAAGPHAAPGVHPQRKRAALTTPRSTPYTQRRRGGVAQLGERYNRTVEVGGSSPPASTTEITRRTPSEIGRGFLYPVRESDAFMRGATGGGLGHQTYSPDPVRA